MQRQNYRYLHTYLMLHHEYTFKTEQKTTGLKGGKQTHRSHYEAKKNKVS